MRRLLVIVTLFLLGAASAQAGGRTSIFYYPWWGTPTLDGAYEHWDRNGRVPPGDVAASFYPARGPYSSADLSVVRAQMHDIAKAGISEVVSSWWGWGSPEDARLVTLLPAARARGLTVAAHVEPYEKWLRTPAVLAADLAHLRELGITRVYVYRPFDDLVDDEAWRVLNRTAIGMEILAQTQNVARAAAAGFDGVYTYDVLSVRAASFRGLCARAHAAGLLCAPSVGPGYDARRATTDRRVRPRRAGATYDGMWRSAVHAGADRVTITSYNEWHEGTQIEAARPRGDYESYDGAWGLRGRDARYAYLARTRYWTAMYRATSSARRVAASVASLFGS